MKLIFLDVDNVLNSSSWFRQVPTPQRFSLDPKCCARVAKICEVTGAFVVMTSSWRLRMKPNHLVDRLVAGGLPRDRILGLTPHALPFMFSATERENSRGMEIQKWLEMYGKPVDNFVILDDKDDMDSLRDRLVRTNPEVGISDADVETAVSRLT